jgi:Uma2 family endonuclease
MTTPIVPEAVEPLTYPDHTHLPSAPGEKARPYKPLPDHTQLPDKDGAFVRNIQEPHQSALLLESLLPVLRRLHPENDYFVGMDTGLYWRIIEPPLRGRKAPDWFYVPGVPHLLKGQRRRSYVLWQEHIAPLVLLEYASGDGAEERDRTPWEGKFWVYEQIVRPSVYGIFEWGTGRLEMFHLVEDRFVPMPANEHGRYPIGPLGVELGVWHGRYNEYDAPWLRWWDAEGIMLQAPGEEAERLKQQVDESRLLAERLAVKLRALGVDPTQI